MRADIPQSSAATNVRLGCAGWTVPRASADHFEAVGSHLARYASRLNATEINSSFHRPHRIATYERWAAAVPEDFRFAVKIPREISHTLRFVDCMPVLERFLAEIAGLSGKLGPLLLQLPPSFAIDAAVAARFFGELRERHEGDVVCEPRHETWFTDSAEQLFHKFAVGRVAADPARVPAAAVHGGWDGIAYARWHGAPRIYFSSYPDEELARMTALLSTAARRGARTWCIFDNTASGVAAGDALRVKARLNEALRT